MRPVAQPRQVKGVGVNGGLVCVERTGSLPLLLLLVRSQSGGMGTCRTPRGERGGSKRKGLRAKLFGGDRALAWGSQNPEGEWPCRARGAAPIRKAWFPYSRACTQVLWEGVAGGNVPLRWVAEAASNG